MTSNEFISKAIYILGIKTTYGWGCFGQEATDSFILSKQKQYPNWYTSSRVNYLKALSNDTAMFDCVGLIKSILWGFPNVRYATGCPDINADTMISKCNDVSADFNNIVDGEVVWMSGHIGIYIGNGYVIEATPNTKYGNGVVRTALLGRGWTKHGKLPYIEYVATISNTSTDNTLDNFINELEALIKKYK